MLCLYFLGLNLSNRQIARELDLDEDSVHDMATQLREGIVAKQPAVVLSGEVECDEVYVVAGHKGHPEAVKKRATGTSATFERGSRTEPSGQREAADSGNDSTFRPSRDAHAGERPASHDRPLFASRHCPGTTVYTDEYDIDSRLKEWGYEHLTVNHGRGEYARDDEIGRAHV